MLAQIEWLSEVKNFFPWVSFVAGVGGSLHCVGMCGGLVAASCGDSKDVVRYQVGRLLGYLFLGLAAGSLGALFNFSSLPRYVSFAPGIFIGILFVFWGIQNWRGKKAEVPTPKFLTKIYSKLFHRFVRNNTNFTRAFFVGLFSIMLPCGLLYGVAIGTLATQHMHEALLSMFFFWLGTVPSMVVAPSVVRGILRPLKRALPRVYAVSLIVIGVMTVSLRLSGIHHAQAAAPSEEAKVHRCH